MTDNLTGLAPAHPGAILREDVLPALKESAGVTKIDFAKMLGLSRQVLDNILKEKAPVTIPTAVRLGKVCGNGAEFWARLQLQHDLWRAEQDIDVSGIPTLKAA